MEYRTATREFVLHIAVCGTTTSLVVGQSGNVSCDVNMKRLDVFASFVDLTKIL